MTKNKKIIILISTIGLILSTVFFLQPSVTKVVFRQTIPLIPSNRTSQATPSQPLLKISPIVPRQTNLDTVIRLGDAANSQAEIQKVSSDLPLRIENFQTSLKQETTINIFTMAADPPSLIHIEIYGVNYNHPEINQSDALAFKESFLLAKKALTTRGVNTKNLQIIFGNRQYIQDTATYWVSAFGLLD